LLLALNFIFKLFEYFFEAIEAHRVFQLDIFLFCEIFDSQTFHCAAAHIGGRAVSLPKEDGIMLQDVVLTVASVFSQAEALVMEPGKLIIRILKALLRKELLDLQWLKALLTI